MKKCCDMKGFLSFIVLRMISARNMSGEEIRCEIEQRRGSKPSPGTIYPVLKSLSECGWIAESGASRKVKQYRITASGRKEAKEATRKFIQLFHDLEGEFSRK